MDHLVRVLFVAIVAILFQVEAIAVELVGFAFVQEDGSLRIQSQNIHLFGIYIPPTDQTCRMFERPIVCGPRAMLALDFKIGQDFVHCRSTATYPDGSIRAICSGGGEDDLSGWMLKNGWALALPDAPFEYTALEKIARARGIGIWGIPVEIPPKGKRPHSSH